VLGMALAWFGWRELVTGAFAGFLLGGVGSMILLLGGSGWKAKIPFGPYMIAGAWLGLAFGGQAAQWYLDVTGISALVPSLS
jgi:leader peptidase (prepilin peptidase) / N-methyltransferase